MNTKVPSGENMETYWSEKHKEQQIDNPVEAPSTFQTEILKQTMVNSNGASYHTSDAGQKKKRKKDNTDGPVPDIIYDLEEDLDRELDIKAQRNNLTATNVKNMIKAVITDSEVLKMIDYSLDKSAERPVYELKLTRAKTKELVGLDQIVGLDQNAIWSRPYTPKNSDLKALINQELSEDSSGEEYEPQDEGSDEDSKANENIVDKESMIDDECSGSDSPVKDVVDLDSSENNSNENIGQRTRSKLCLSETPLEEIEQAFIPPDITTDMLYNTHCDNPDYLTFLKEIYFDGIQLENNDDENDPDFNVMIDEETEGTDVEELSFNRAVKVTKKELNELMSELSEYTEMLSSEYTEMLSSDEEEESKDDDLKAEDKIVSTDTTSVSTVPLNRTSSSLSTSLAVKVNRQSDKEIEEKKVICNKYYQFSENQNCLLKQQLQQHVQLLLQSFLLSYKHPLLPDSYSLECKNRIKELNVFKNSSTLTGSFSIINLDCSVDLINKWIKYLNDHEKDASMKMFMEAELEKFNFFKKKKHFYLPELHPKLIELCLSSCAFMYPLYLPKGGFTGACSTKKGFSFYEDQLIAMGLEEFSDLLGLLPDKNLLKIVESISYNLVVTKSTLRIMAHIRRLRKSPTGNPIKEYFETRKAPKVHHYVVVQSSLKKLREYPMELFPESWEKYLKN